MPDPDNIGKKLAEYEIKRILALAAELGITPEDFADEVLRLKKEEAQSKNNAGLQAQLEYIFSTYGDSVDFVKKAKKRVTDTMKDYAPPGKLVQCASCGETEFRSRAHRAGEGYACEECWRVNDMARKKAEERINKH
jgi:formylmethanofuran dehydrogenase subunit E